MNIVNSPQDLKNLSRAELKELAAEIREAIIRRVDNIGGYGEKIASYLGAKDVRVLNYGAAKENVSNEPRDIVMKRYRMTPEQIAEDVLGLL